MLPPPPPVTTGKRKADGHEPLFGHGPPGYRAGVGRGMVFGKGVGDTIGAALDGGGRRERLFGHSTQIAQNEAELEDADDDKVDYSDAQFDEFSGYAGNLFGKDKYEQDDRDADSVWAAVDDAMEARRSTARRKREAAALAAATAERPKVYATFADLKHELKSVSLDEWSAIPDIGDNSLRFKRKEQRFTPAPDSLLERARLESARDTSIDTRSGLQTPAPSSSAATGAAADTSGTMTDLNQVGEARKTVLSLKLKEAGDSVSGQTNVDPKGYLTDLNSQKINSEAEIGDIKKAELLLTSVVTTNPKHAPGWIALARLHEVAGKLVQARRDIDQGCLKCADNEDVWLEAARLHTPANAASLLARAVQHNPQSIRIWLRAAELESDPSKRKRVLRKALEHIPNSVRLWKAAVQLEAPDDARVLLGRAVECAPHSVELWLALARLETYENARKVLNDARKQLPAEPSIWITAARLEESNGNEKMLDAIVQRAVKSLAANGVVLERDQWIAEAEATEKAGSVRTAQALIRATIDGGVEPEDRKRIWLDDVEALVGRGSLECARAVLAHALVTFPTKKSLWLRAAELEKRHASPADRASVLLEAAAAVAAKSATASTSGGGGERSVLDRLLETAVSQCPTAEVLWLMWAKDRAVRANVDGARQVLQQAFAQNPNSEHIWLAAVTLERDNQEVARARSLLARARERAGTERVWMKSALLERDQGKPEDERVVLDEALQRFPQAPKLWMMRAQLAERAGDVEAARQFYERGLKNAPQSVPLWICAARLEARQQNFAKARALLEKGRARNPKTDLLWLEAIRVEHAAKQEKIGEALLSKALQECPVSGVLWAAAIELAPRAQRRARSVDALKRCGNDALVVLAVGKLFWAERMLEKARTWLARATLLDASLGDAWAALYKFEAQFGDAAARDAVLARAADAEPRYGEAWTRVSKDAANFGLKTRDILVRVALQIEAL
jgi:pre-mRNA-processing factor 6